MDFLWNNPLGAMCGPHFLLLYLILCCLVIGTALYLGKTRPENPEGFAPPLTIDPDPYAVAFLREGQDEVIRLAFVSLVQKGRLEIVQKNRWYGSRLKLMRARNPGASDPHQRPAPLHLWVQSIAAKTRLRLAVHLQTAKQADRR